MKSTIATVLTLITFAQPVGAQSPIQLQDVTASSGIRFVHSDGSSGKRYIVEAIASGLALFDYDGDGDEDIYFLNGAPQPPDSGSGPPPRNALYRNDGDFRFTDVTELAGVGDTGHGLGVAAGDYDNDGDLDLYVNNYGPNVLYRNNNDGTFTAVTEKAGLGGHYQVGAGCCFLDIEGDGDLDLYVASYVDFAYDTHVPHMLLGLPTHPSPLDYKGVADLLYRNEGDGTFTDVSAESGIGQFAGTGMGMICADYDNDGDTDIFVANDVMGNFLFQNDGRGKFEEVGTLSGVAFDFRGTPQGSMGADFGDFNNDGWLDLLVTSFSGEMTTLYQNLGSGLFDDVSRQSGVGAPTLPHVTWGDALVDFDNDGDRDIYVACGDLDDNVHLRNDATAYMLPNILLLNTGQDRYEDVSNSSGDGLAVRRSSRGTAFADLNGDGRQDGVVLNIRSEPTVLGNASPGDNHWLGIRLRGTKSNRDGIGAQVRVRSGDRVLLDEVHSGRGYQSHYGLQLHFGLGSHEQVDQVEVRWIGGGVETIDKPPIDRVLTIVEGTSQPVGG